MAIKLFSLLARGVVVVMEVAAAAAAAAVRLLAAVMLCHVIASLPEAHSHIVWELVDDEFSAIEDVHMRFQHILEVR